MTNELVSIIIPVYKVERFLGRCLDSIRAQTFQNFEVLLVDDGSPDRCPEICDEYAAKDARFKAIHKQNGGVSSARNVGIENAVGEYLLFVDSDDVIHNDILEKSIKEIQSSRADAVVFGVSMNAVDSDGESIKCKTEMIPDMKTYRCHTAQEVINGPFRYMYGVPYQDMQEVLFHNRFLYSQFVWVYCWLYKRKIVEENSIRFREDISIREDGLFNYEYLAHVDSTSCVEQIGYEYYKRDDGAASTLHRNIKVENKIGIAQYRHLIRDFVLQRSGIDVADWAYGSYALSCIQLAYSLSSEKDGYKKLKRYIKLDDVHKAIKKVPLKGGIKLVLPLLLAKIGCYRLLFWGCKALKKCGFKI